MHAGIRDHVVQAVELKFNCFFLMPVVDSFPTRLREELESAYDDDIDEVFDVTAVRNALESRLKALESELHQVPSVKHSCQHSCNIQTGFDAMRRLVTSQATKQVKDCK